MKVVVTAKRTSDTLLVEIAADSGTTRHNLSISEAEAFLEKYVREHPDDDCTLYEFKGHLPYRYLESAVSCGLLQAIYLARRTT